MRMGLKKTLLSIFLDFTIDGERVKTIREYKETNGRRHLSRVSKVIPDTGEVLREDFYSPERKTPYASYFRRAYILT